MQQLALFSLPRLAREEEEDGSISNKAREGEQDATNSEADNASRESWSSYIDNMSEVGSVGSIPDTILVEPGVHDQGNTRTSGIGPLCFK